ncbi:soluble lamin-associated protein of 75 kDa isoform X2 [Gymnodraco acuticeps]|uniref:Soluble lamin-associated protein of 75 kDa isoform X2 n=1 Tax=Gymnodraco acuticeps TaxID=8218 RepID=A0A6P8SLT9_GYMAC|nr:soluble lamin-associated protein of 75 kDa isoform X2 [Gymnodraco acuticeps]
MYPVDLPAVEDTDLTSVSELYLSSLESGTHNEEWFELSHTSKVAITANNVRLLQLFDDHQSDCTLLALHPPNDPTQVLALYLQDQWWSVDDALRTCCKDRNGLISVQSLMERVIVFLLSQVLERSPQEKTLFSLHPRTESCKLLWRDSQAVGFYTIKHKVCRSFLQQHEEHLESLYEVEAPGGWTQRRNIWLSIQLGRYTSCIKEESGPASGDTQRNNDSSLKSSDCRPDPESCSDVDAPLVTGSSAQQLELCAQRRAGRSPSSCVSGTGCCPAAHAEDLDSGPPCRPPQSLNTQQALKPKPSVSAEPGEVEEEQRNAKRVRRT